MDRQRVLPDDLAARIDAVRDGGTHAGNGKFESGVLPVSEQESALPAASGIEADDVPRALMPLAPVCAAAWPGARPAGQAAAAAVAGQETSIEMNV